VIICDRCGKELPTLAAPYMFRFGYIDSDGKEQPRLVTKADLCSTCSNLIKESLLPKAIYDILHPPTQQKVICPKCGSREGVHGGCRCGYLSPDIVQTGGRQ
jgi:hypothetical protein